MRSNAIRAALRLTLFAPFLCAAIPSTGAAVDAYDSFDYAAGNPLNKQNGGIGWNNAWAVLAAAQDGKIANVGLAFGALAVGGKAATTTAGNNTTQDVRDTTVQVGGNATTKYLSFLMKPKGPMQNPGSPFGGLFWGPVLGNHLYIGRTQSTNNYCLSNGAVGGMLDGEVCSNTAPALNTTVFLVVRVDFKQGNDTIKLYVNPDPGGAEPAAADATKNDLDLDNGAQFRTVYLHSKSDWDFDEIRIATAYGDVTPAAVVQSPCEAGGVLIARLTPTSMRVSWNSSHTLNAVDHGVYEGTLGSWYNHVLLDCTDDGEDFAEVVMPSPGNRYYLVVPRNVVVEGSYGQSSDGDERPPGFVACAPQFAGPTCHFKDATDVGDQAFTAGCHYQFSDALCTNDESFFSGDKCTSPSPNPGVDFLDLLEWTSQACHPDEDDVKIHYCDAECQAMGHTSGHCEVVGNACGVGNNSARCVCVP